MSEDVAVAAAWLIADGLAEETKEDEPGGLRITSKGYDKGYNIWMVMSGEDRLLVSLFLRKVRMI